MPRLHRTVDKLGVLRYKYNNKTFLAAKVSKIQIRGKWYTARKGAEYSHRAPTNILSGMRSYGLEVKVPVFDRDVWIDAEHFSTQIDNIAIRQYGQAPAFLLA